MGNTFNLRSLLGTMIISALILLVFQLALKNREEHIYTAFAIVIAVPVVTLGSFGLMYILMLPFGVVAKAFSENAELPTSPFAQDRLPERLVSVDERAD